MAQWVPKTAWRVSNLNKRYGQPYVTRGNFFSEQTECYSASYASAFHQKRAREKIIEACRAAQKTNAGQTSAREALPGTCLIDVRDASERRRITLPLAVPVHPHDLLSGAALPLLPWDKNQAKLFVVASTDQRGVNALAALRRWGYNDVNILDVEAAASLCDPESGSELLQRNEKEYQQEA